MLLPVWIAISALVCACDVLNVLFGNSLADFRTDHKEYRSISAQNHPLPAWFPGGPGAIATLISSPFSSEGSLTRGGNLSRKLENYLDLVAAQMSMCFSTLRASRKMDS